MLRKMGLRYDRVDIDGKNSRNDGAVVPTDVLTSKIYELFENLKKNPTCVLEKVLLDPFLENIENKIDLISGD